MDYEDKHDRPDKEPNPALLSVLKTSMLNNYSDWSGNVTINNHVPIKHLYFWSW